ncbi:hypothetical protein OPT61_g4537 [Boeremia exigua]|uniref:Uncharacterized protein n=1 Tax=Boeremia exigua TaxID=749465 RepID=A0ACC2IDR7_9PLEO|nr:hypothetical protein OPT61_g4537 [Boeremia exigua]
MMLAEELIELDARNKQLLGIEGVRSKYSYTSNEAGHILLVHELAYITLKDMSVSASAETDADTSIKANVTNFSISIGGIVAIKARQQDLELNDSTSVNYSYMLPAYSSLCLAASTTGNTLAMLCADSVTIPVRFCLYNIATARSCSYRVDRLVIGEEKSDAESMWDEVRHAQDRQAPGEHWLVLGINAGSYLDRDAVQLHVPGFVFKKASAPGKVPHRAPPHHIDPEQSLECSRMTCKPIISSRDLREHIANILL